MNVFLDKILKGLTVEQKLWWRKNSIVSRDWSIRILQSLILFIRRSESHAGCQAVLRIRIRMDRHSSCPFGPGSGFGCADPDPDVRIRIQLLKHWRRKPKLTVISDVFRDYNIQMVKVS